MKNLQRRFIVCFAAVLAATTVASAQPAVTGASGTFSNGQTVTISGSSFGTKTVAAPVMWDNCSTGTYPTDKGWSGYWPSTSTNTAYRLHYTAPIRGIGLPHSNITRYMAGAHADGTGADNGEAVMAWMNRTVSSFPAYTYASWYYRADDNWVFNLNNQDNNFKSYDWSTGTGPYGNPTNWYINYCPPHPMSSTDSARWGINDDGASLMLPNDMNGHSNTWDSATNVFSGVWVKEQIEIKITNQNDGYIKMWDNGVSTIRYVGPTDKYTGTARNDGIGGYSRNYPNGNNYRYFADIYLDYTPSRIVLANNSNIDNATIVENQIPSAWSATSITATVNMGQFATGTAYLFVYDSTGAHNATGWPVTLSGPSLPTVTIATTTPYASEAGLVNGVVTVTRTGSTGSSLTVNYGVSGSAVSGRDYTALSGSVTIPSGSSTANINIVPIDNGIITGNLTVNVTLMVTTNYTVNTSSPCRATVTIADTDGPSGSGTIVDWGSSAGTNVYGCGFATPFLGNYVSYYTTAPYGVKGGSTGTYTTMTVTGTGHMFNVGDQIVVTWYNTSASSITIHPKVSLDLATTVTPVYYGNDVGTWYPMTTVTIPANGGPVTSTYTIDSSSAGTHLVVAVCRYDDNYSGAMCDKVELQSATLPTVTVSATTPNASESGPTNGQFTVTRNGSTSSSLVVNYAMSGTATNGTDYTTLSGSVTINSGSSTATINVVPLNDSLIEGNETVILNISANPSNYTVGSPSTATVTIADNDYVLVNFGSSAAGNTFGTSWNNAFIGRWSSYSAAGPYGVTAGDVGTAHSGGVSIGTGTAYTFTTGQVVVATWYNSGTTAVTFTPEVSFDDSNDPDNAPAGTWHNMSTVTSLAAGATTISTYTVDATTAGSHTIVNVCRQTASVYNLVLDKIELQSPTGTGNSPMILTGGGGAGAMTVQQPAQSLPAKRTVGWQPATPAAQPATKK